MVVRSEREVAKDRGVTTVLETDRQKSSLRFAP